jgi:hypothetical protein
MCTRISELVLGGGAFRENCAAELRSDESCCVASKSPAGDSIRKRGMDAVQYKQHLPHYSRVPSQVSSFGR